MATDSVLLTLIGGPTLLVETAGLRLLTDPTFDLPERQPIGTIVFEKTSGPAIPAADVGPLDAVLLSHDQHFDNLDHAGRALLADVPAIFTTPAGASRLGTTARGLEPFQTVSLEGANGAHLLVTGTPARHGPIGIESISGPVTGFLLGREQPGDIAYLTGDTVWYEGVAEVARRFAPPLVILFTGSAEPRGRFHMTMDSNDAIAAAHAFPRATIAAIHNEGWAHFKESQAELAQSFHALGLGARFLPLERGRRMEVKLAP